MTERNVSYKQNHLKSFIRFLSGVNKVIFPEDARLKGQSGVASCPKSEEGLPENKAEANEE